jgi:hypothetical protein
MIADSLLCKERIFLISLPFTAFDSKQLDVNGLKQK